jgi:hypothetical protein
MLALSISQAYGLYWDTERGTPLEGKCLVIKEMQQKGQEGCPLISPLSLHYVTSLTLRIIGETDIKKLIIPPNLVNAPGL